jgi:hypothetical protein
MLFYVEVGVEYTNTYGDINEPFYNSMESMYKRAVEYIVENELQEEYEGRCRGIVKDASGIGWGFHDGLRYIYEGSFVK